MEGEDEEDYSTSAFMPVFKSTVWAPDPSGNCNSINVGGYKEPNVQMPSVSNLNDLGPPSIPTALRKRELLVPGECLPDGGSQKSACASRDNYVSIPISCQFKELEQAQKSPFKKHTEGLVVPWTSWLRWTVCVLTTCLIVITLCSGYFSPPGQRENNSITPGNKVQMGPTPQETGSASNRLERPFESNVVSNLFKLQKRNEKTRESDSRTVRNFGDPGEVIQHDTSLRKIVYKMGIPLNEYLSQINVNITDLVHRALALGRSRVPHTGTPDDAKLRDDWCKSLSLRANLRVAPEVQNKPSCFKSRDFRISEGLVYWQVPFEEISSAFFEGGGEEKSLPEKGEVHKGEPFPRHRLFPASCSPGEDPTCSRYAGALPSPLKAAISDETAHRIFLRRMQEELAILFGTDARGYRCCCTSGSMVSKCGTPRIGVLRGYEEFVGSSLADELSKSGANFPIPSKNHFKLDEWWTCGLLAPSNENDGSLVFGMLLDLSRFTKSELFRCGLQLILDNGDNNG